MIRNLKVLGLALVAILAMSAMVASAASATNATFTSGADTTTIEGEDEGTVTLSVTGVTVTCTKVSYHGEITGKAVESVTVDPTYQECTALGGFVEAKVTGFGDWGEEASKQCDFVLRANGTADLVCPAGVSVTVDAGTCVVHIPGQTGLKTITYTTGTRNGVHDLTLDVNINNITTTHTDGFACPLPSGGHSSDATLVGPITAWGTNVATGLPTPITWDAATP